MVANTPERLITGQRGGGSGVGFCFCEMSEVSELQQKKPHLLEHWTGRNHPL